MKKLLIVFCLISSNCFSQNKSVEGFLKEYIDSIKDEKCVIVKQCNRSAFNSEQVKMIKDGLLRFLSKDEIEKMLVIKDTNMELNKSFFSENRLIDRSVVNKIILPGTGGPLMSRNDSGGGEEVIQSTPGDEEITKSYNYPDVIYSLSVPVFDGKMQYAVFETYCKTSGSSYVIDIYLYKYKDDRWEYTGELYYLIAN